MKKISIVLLVFTVLVSCAEKIIAEPENLIPQGKMTDILYDVAVLVSAKNSSKAILVKNNIEIMDYIYEKYSIDSIQYVQSDIYYASIPATYQDIYIGVETRLDNERRRLQEEREHKNDSVVEAVQTNRPKKAIGKPIPKEVRDNKK